MMPIDKTNIKDAEYLYWCNINTSSTKITNMLKYIHMELQENSSNLPVGSILYRINELTLNSQGKPCSQSGKILTKEEKKALIKEFIFMSPEEMQRYIANDQIKAIESTGNAHKLYRQFDSIKTKELYREIKKILGLNICPYCNRLFIDAYGSHNLDHFIPRSIYPIFSICFYNLIPVCPGCNNNKSDNTYTYFQNPYSDDFEEDSVTFHPVLKFNANKLECTLHIEYKDEENNGHKELSSIKEGYLDNIEYTIDRLRIYDLMQSPYLTNQLKLFSEPSQHNINTLISLLLGHNILENKINLRPFEKLDRDIHADMTK